jgi:alpha-N-acetylglucosaminidase
VAVGLYGQLENVTYNPIEALGNSTSTMVGMGLTMEGQEGNQVMYDILLDQAWSEDPLDTELYFRSWIESRYNGVSLPSGVYEAWDIMRRTVYNNTDLELSTSVTKSIFELSPNTTGLPANVSHHSTETTYNPDVLVRAWVCLYHAAAEESTLWDNAAYAFDLTDVTRQVLANAFVPLYEDFIAAANRSLDSYAKGVASKKGEKMTELLSDLDAVLSASGETHFSLPAWIASARMWASPLETTETSNVSSSTGDRAAFYEYNARNQITLWGPTGQINDYASKQWAGLIESYYVPRWKMFVEWSLNSTTKVDGENMGLSEALLSFEEAWQHQTWGEAVGESYVEPTRGELQMVIGEVVGRWPGVFSA